MGLIVSTTLALKVDVMTINNMVLNIVCPTHVWLVSAKKKLWATETIARNIHVLYQDVTSKNFLTIIAILILPNGYMNNK